MALPVAAPVTAQEQPQEEVQAAELGERITRAQTPSTVLTVAAVLTVVDIRSEHPAASWAAVGVWASVATTTLWEIRLRRTRQSVVVVARDSGYRMGW